MTPQRVKRKLTAIFSADVQGYSRLMRDDEMATVHTLTAYREIMGSRRNHPRRLSENRESAAEAV
jgi:class 3 adenylate cyclase